MLTPPFRHGSFSRDLYKSRNSPRVHFQLSGLFGPQVLPLATFSKSVPASARKVLRAPRLHALKILKGLKLKGLLPRQLRLDPRISCFEFVELGRKYSSYTPTELRQIFACVNVSRTGKLSYCEWLAAGAPANWYSQQCNAERAPLDVQDL